MHKDETKTDEVVPDIVAKSCGIFAGTTLGYGAGKAVAEAILPHLTADVQEMGGLLTVGVEAIGIFGCGTAGYLAAIRNPNQAPLAAASAAIALSIASKKKHEDHFSGGDYASADDELEAMAISNSDGPIGALTTITEDDAYYDEDGLLPTIC